MRHLSFPVSETVGTLDWLGARDDVDGPILATGVVDVPDDVEVSLSVWRIRSVERDSFSGGGFIMSRVTRRGEVVTERTSSAGWRLSGGHGPLLHLGFLLELPRDSITALDIGQDVLPESLTALPHLAPGLKRLYLTSADLGDEVLPSVARLDNLVYLQTFGNRFTNKGMQCLADLSNLETLYLEEETLTAPAFAFATRLTRLRRLGLLDVPITADELSALRSQLPGVEVG